MPAKELILNVMLHEKCEANPHRCLIYGKFCSFQFAKSMRKCHLESSKIHHVYARRCKTMARNYVQNIIKMWPKTMRNSMILVPRGSQNRSKLFRGALRKRSWKQVGPGTPKKCQRQLHGTSIWVLFGWSWAPFWPPLGAKRSQNQAFWHQGCAKIWKYDIQNEAAERNLNFNWTLSRKCKFLNGLNLPKCFI